LLGLDGRLASARGPLSVPRRPMILRRRGKQALEFRLARQSNGPIDKLPIYAPGVSAHESLVLSEEPGKERKGERKRAREKVDLRYLARDNINESAQIEARIYDACDDASLIQSAELHESPLHCNTFYTTCVYRVRRIIILPLD
jgi:hypothetical protein